MEIIRLSGYTEGERLIIARDYLIPRQIRENSLRPAEFLLKDEALQEIIRSYTREAGVRSLEREIGRACCKVATPIAEGTAQKVTVRAGDGRELVGNPRS